MFSNVISHEEELFSPSDLIDHSMEMFPFEYNFIGN